VQRKRERREREAERGQGRDKQRPGRPTAKGKQAAEDRAAAVAGQDRAPGAGADRRAAELFTTLTRPLDPAGRGWTLHQLSAAGGLS
jgi:hypothetical protein